MSRLLVILVLVTALVACREPAQAPPAALQTPTSASIALAPRPYLTAQPTLGVVPATDLPTSDPALLQTVVWHGLRFQYDSQRYRFSETVPYAGDSRPLATASFSYTVDPCSPGMADCPAAAAFLALYSRGGLDFQTWLAQQTVLYSYDPAGDFTEDVVAGQPAAYWAPAGLGGPAIAVSVGEDVLVIFGYETAELAQTMQLEHPDETPLAVGHIALTKPDRKWDLWSDAVDGERVLERPQLHGSSFVSILAIEPQAVQVRTPEGVTGWIHAAAPEAFSTRLALLGDYAPIGCVIRTRVAQGHAIPLREGPRSTAGQVGALLMSGQEIEVVSVRGDWVRVYSSAGSGWVRWYYDGARYVDNATQCS